MTTGPELINQQTGVEENTDQHNDAGNGKVLLKELPRLFAHLTNSGGQVVANHQTVGNKSEERE